MGLSASDSEVRQRWVTFRWELMWIDKAATFNLARELGGQGLGRGSWLFWSRKPTAAIWVTARFATTGATAAENARRASCAPMGLRDGRLHGDRPQREAQRLREGIVFLLLFALTRTDRGQGLDGAALHPVRCLAAAARSSPRLCAGLSIMPGGSCHECGRL